MRFYDRYIFTKWIHYHIVRVKKYLARITTKKMARPQPPRDIYIVREINEDRLMVCINYNTFAYMTKESYATLKDKFDKEKVK